MVIYCFLFIILSFASFFLKPALDYFLTESPEDLKSVFNWLSLEERQQITNTIDDLKTIFDVSGYVSAGLAVFVILAIVVSIIRIGKLFKRVYPPYLFTTFTYSHQSLFSIILLLDQYF